MGLKLADMINLSMVCPGIRKFILCNLGVNASGMWKQSGSAVTVGEGTSLGA